MWKRPKNECRECSILTEIALIKFSSKGDCTQQWNRSLAPNAVAVVVAAVDDDMLSMPNHQREATFRNGLMSKAVRSD